MFYSTRYFWRLVVFIAVLYLAATRVPWKSVEISISGLWYRVERKVQNLGNDLGDSLDELLNGIKNILK
jgi:hypothetical protein